MRLGAYAAQITFSARAAYVSNYYSVTALVLKSTPYTSAEALVYHSGVECELTHVIGCVTTISASFDAISG
jgi:hypothetical protein